MRAFEEVAEKEILHLILSKLLKILFTHLSSSEFKIMQELFASFPQNSFKKLTCHFYTSFLLSSISPKSSLTMPSCFFISEEHSEFLPVCIFTYWPTKSPGTNKNS